MIRKIVLTILILISYLCQTTFNSTISIGGITPNLLVILVCVFSLLRGRKEGMLVGFFAGILLDLFYGYGNVVGFNALIFTYLGYFIGFFKEVIYTDDILIPIAFTAIADIAYNFVIYFIAFALRNKLEIGMYFKRIMLPELIYTVFLSIFLYKLYKYINDKLEAHETKKENSTKENIS